MAVSLRFDAQINRINAVSNNVGNASIVQPDAGRLSPESRQSAGSDERIVGVCRRTSPSPTRIAPCITPSFQHARRYITDIASKDFNGVSLFSSTALSVTTDSDAGSYSMTGVNLGASAYTTATGSNISTKSGAATALTNVKSAITQLTTDRSTVGASLQRLNMTNEQLGVLKDNLSAANSRIKDVDVAYESTQFAKYNILVQSGTAMLAQANQNPQSALRLLS